MLRYTFRRMLIMIPTLIVISLVTFVIIQLPPGDFLSNQIAELQSQGDKAATEKAEFLRKQYGLDRPLPLGFRLDGAAQRDDAVAGVPRRSGQP